MAGQVAPWLIQVAKSCTVCSGSFALGGILRPSSAWRRARIRRLFAASPGRSAERGTAIAGPVTHVWIDGGDHGLRGRDKVVAEAVRDWVLQLS